MLLKTQFLNSNPVELCKLGEKSKIMANSTGQFSSTSSASEGDVSKPDWKIPLAKLNSAVIQEKEDAKEAIHQLLLLGSKQCHAIMGDLFSLYVRTSCRAAGEILLDQSQQSHVNVGIVCGMVTYDMFARCVKFRSCSFLVDWHEIVANIVWKCFMIIFVLNKTVSHMN